MLHNSPCFQHRDRLRLSSTDLGLEDNNPPDVDRLALCSHPRTAGSPMVDRPKLLAWILCPTVFRFCGMAEEVAVCEYSSCSVVLGAGRYPRCGIHASSWGVWRGVVFLASFAAHADRRTGDLLPGLADAPRDPVSTALPDSDDSDPCHHFESDHPSFADSRFQARRLEPSPLRSAGSAGRKHHQSASHAAGSGRRMQWN